MCLGALSVPSNTSIRTKLQVPVQVRTIAAAAPNDSIVGVKPQNHMHMHMHGHFSAKQLPPVEPAQPVLIWGKDVIGGSPLPSASGQRALSIGPRLSTFQSHRNQFEHQSGRDISLW